MASVAPLVGGEAWIPGRLIHPLVREFLNGREGGADLQLYMVAPPAITWAFIGFHSLMAVWILAPPLLTHLPLAWKCHDGTPQLPLWQTGWLAAPICVALVAELCVLRFTVLPLVQANKGGFRVCGRLLPFPLWFAFQIAQSIMRYVDVVLGALFVARSWIWSQVCKGGGTNGAWVGTPIWILVILKFAFAARRTWPLNPCGRSTALTDDFTQQNYDLLFDTAMARCCEKAKASAEISLNYLSRYTGMTTTSNKEEMYITSRLQASYVQGPRSTGRLTHRLSLSSERRSAWFALMGLGSHGFKMVAQSVEIVASLQASQSPDPTGVAHLLSSWFVAAKLVHDTTSFVLKWLKWQHDVEAYLPDMPQEELAKATSEWHLTQVYINRLRLGLAFYFMQMLCSGMLVAHGLWASRS